MPERDEVVYQLLMSDPSRTDWIYRLIRAMSDAGPATEEERDNTPSEELLTPRQIDCLRLISHGIRDPEISEILGISEDTIKDHIRKLMITLCAPNRTYAVAYAIRRGIIE